MLSFKLPDLGEGLQDAEILEWKVKEGDSVDVDQLVLVVETAKAVVEIPSPVKAVIENIAVGSGESVAVGTDLFFYKGVLEESSDGASVNEVELRKENSSDHKSVSVVGKLEERAAENGVNSCEGAVVGVDEVVGAERAQKFNLQKNRRDAPSRQLTTPAILAFARKLGLHNHLEECQYSELSENDLLCMYEDLRQQESEREGGESSIKDRVVKLSGARKVMAQSMTKSHQHIPSVTLFDDANISHWNEREDITVRVISALITACKKVPLLNAWFDEESLSVQMFDDIHLGVAVNASEGLFVPVIRKAQELDGARIRQILDRHVVQVENRSIKPQKLLGATISLSNFGTLSGRYATPIIVPPQVAIVGVGKVSSQPVVCSGELSVGRVMPISLSFDHRAASGADAAAFLSEMISALTVN